LVNILSQFRDHSADNWRHLVDIFQKTESLSVLDPQTLSIRFLGSNNLALANGEDWKRRRKVSIRFKCWYSDTVTNESSLLVF
jgi:hypothetical protein